MLQLLQNDETIGVVGNAFFFFFFGVPGLSLIIIHPSLPCLINENEE
jgi:hypothetical protein